jgi:hypothetical protein
VALLGGCGDDAGGGSGGGGGEGGSTATGGTEPIDAVQARFASFTTEGFTQVSRDPIETQHGNAPRVAIWVSDGELASYRAIDPADTAATAGPFPVGTMIVKQNLAEDGTPLGGATVLAKQADGFAPDTGNWLWARFGDSGAVGESGASGEVDYCIDCHASNELQDTDWLKGVALDNRL